MKIKEIKEGYKEYFSSILNQGNPAITAVAEKRLEVCYTCSKRIVFICGGCGCPLAVKARSISSTCPLKKWDKN